MLISFSDFIFPTLLSRFCGMFALLFCCAPPLFVFAWLERKMIVFVSCVVHDVITGVGISNSRYWSSFFFLIYCASSWHSCWKRHFTFNSDCSTFTTKAGYTLHSYRSFLKLSTLAEICFRLASSQQLPFISLAMVENATEPFITVNILSKAVVVSHFIIAHKKSADVLVC